MVIAPMFTRQRGQSWRAGAEASARWARAPQWEQNFAPKNIMPKQAGQAMVARRAPQWSHRVAALEAAAPHMGQLSDWADIASMVFRRRPIGNYEMLCGSESPDNSLSAPPSNSRLAARRWRWILAACPKFWKPSPPNSNVRVN